MDEAEEIQNAAHVGESEETSPRDFAYQVVDESFEHAR